MKVYHNGRWKTADYIKAPEKFDGFIPQLEATNGFERKYADCKKGDILHKLRKLAKRTIKKRDPYKVRRKNRHPIQTGTKCFVCKKNANVEHHMIMLINGGYDIPANRIPLCNFCHSQVHNWMRPDGTLKKRKRKFKARRMIEIPNEIKAMNEMFRATV